MVHLNECSHSKDMLVTYAMKVAGEIRIFLSFLGNHSMIIRKMEGKTQKTPACHNRERADTVTNK